MIRSGKQYRRRRHPHTVVTVTGRRHGKVSYELKKTTMTISVRSFKDIYERYRR